MIFSSKIKGIQKHPSSALTLLGWGSSSTVLVCIMAKVAAFVVGCRMEDGGDETELVVVDSKRPAESTDCGGAGDAAAVMSNPPPVVILSR